ncbi:hypothetical protein [Roseateles sp. P5_E4]
MPDSGLLTAAAILLIGGLLLTDASSAGELPAVAESKPTGAQQVPHLDGEGVLVPIWNHLADLLPAIPRLTARQILAYLGAEYIERTREQEPNLGADRFLSGLISNNAGKEIHVAIFESPKGIQLHIDWETAPFNGLGCDRTLQLDQSFEQAGWKSTHMDLGHHIYMRSTLYVPPIEPANSKTTVTLTTRSPACITNILVRSIHP